MPALPLAVSLATAVAALVGCDGTARDGETDSALATAALPVTRPPVLPAAGRVDAPGQVYVDSMGKANAHLTGGQLVAAATALNDAEIAAARLALGEARTSTAHDFATRMIDEHAEANQSLGAIASRDTLQPKASAQQQYAERLGTQTLSLLRGLAPEKFDSAYVGSQIGAHRAALAMLDMKLIPGADRTDLRGYFISLRSTVDEHLQRAIQAAATLAMPEEAR